MMYKTVSAMRKYQTNAQPLNINHDFSVVEVSNLFGRLFLADCINCF